MSERRPEDSAAATGEAAGWVEHDGKGMPVEAGAVVDVRYRDGVVMKRKAYALHDPDSSCSDWIWPPTEDDSCDIVAYRVVTA